MNMIIVGMMTNTSVISFYYQNKEGEPTPGSRFVASLYSPLHFSFSFEAFSWMVELLITPHLPHPEVVDKSKPE